MQNCLWLRTIDTEKHCRFTQMVTVAFSPDLVAAEVIGKWCVPPYLGSWMDAKKGGPSGIVIGISPRAQGVHQNFGSNWLDSCQKPNPYIFCYIFSRCLLNAYHLLDIVVGTGYAMLKKKKRCCLLLHEAYSLGVIHSVNMCVCL